MQTQMKPEHWVGTLCMVISGDFFHSKPPRFARSFEFSFFFQMERRNVTEREEKEFVPLRKSLKRKAGEKEDNLVTPYYHEQNSITQLSDEQVDEIRWQNGIEIKGENCSKPITSFKDLNLPPKLQGYLSNNGYARPTAIHMQAQ